MNGQVFKNAQDEYQSDYAGINLIEELQALESLNKALCEVVGQETACEKIRESLFGCLRRNTTGPLASLLFIGAPAGKSFTAEKIAIAFDRPYKSFDLSTFSNRDTAVIELTGLDRSYKGAEPGSLTGFLVNNPGGSVVVLENIDKMPDGASSIITNLLKGNVHDAYFDTEVSSKDTIIIMTVAAEIPKRKISLKSILSEIDSVTNRPLLPHGIVSCIGENNIVVFNELKPFDIYNIVMAEIDKRVDSLNECYGLRLHFKPYKLAYLFTLSHAGENVRTVLSAVDSFFQQLILNISISIKEDGMRLKGADVVINFNSSSGEAKEYLVPKINILALDVEGCKVSQRRMKTFAVETATSDSSSASWFGADAIIVQVKKNNIENLKNTFKGIRCSSPIYFFSSEKIPLQAFKEYGTVSYLTKFSDVLNSISEELEVNIAAKKLQRAQRIIKYNINYKYLKKYLAARVTLSDFRTEIAFQAADADKFLAEIPNVRFDDVVGNNEAKIELASVLNMLKNPTFYLRRNITLPRAMLFQGAPGTGKTLMARALASQCQLPFIECNATKFLDKYVGDGAKSVRQLFSVARKYAPCVVFIDEIDAVVKSRDNAEDSRHTQDVTNSFLSELDGFLKYDETPVFLICATNFSVRGENTKLDKAFLRRFGRIIFFDLPKLADRKEFIQRELCKYDFSSVTDNKISEIATRSVGMSLSDLSHVIQNAVRCCECDGEFRLTDGVFNEAFESYSSGARKIYDAETIRRTALHEAGHAVVAAILGFKPAYTTIVSRADYGGFMQYAQEENKSVFTRQELLNKICAALAGRASEEHFYQADGITTGAASDFKLAVEIAKNMISVYAFEPDLIYCVGQENEAEAVAARIQRIVTEQYERVKKLICEHANRVKVVAEALVKEESLSEERLRELLL